MILSGELIFRPQWLHCCFLKYWLLFILNTKYEWFYVLSIYLRCNLSQIVSIVVFIVVVLYCLISLWKVVNSDCINCSNMISHPSSPLFTRHVSGLWVWQMFWECADDCSALKKIGVSSASESSVCSVNISSGRWQELLHSLVIHHYLISLFPLTQYASVVSLRYWCDQSGAGLSPHPRVQHWHHCHSPSGSSSQSWEQVSSCHTGRLMFYQILQPI